MALNDYEEYMLWLNTLSEMHKLIDPQNNSDFSKRHRLNDFLGFGLSKEDVCLYPLVDQWTNRDDVSIDAFVYWVRHKLYPFMSHGKILEKPKLKKTLVFLSGEVEKIIRNTEIGNRGEHFTTSVDEIKATLSLFSIELECRSIKELGYNIKGDTYSWEKRWRESINRSIQKRHVCPEIIQMIKEAAALYP